MLSVLHEFAICFSDCPGLYPGAVNRIETAVEFKPKRMWGLSRARSVQAGRAETDKVTVGHGAHPTVSQSDGQSDHLRGQEKWRGTSGCGLSLLKLIYSSRCIPGDHSKRDSK